MDNDNKTEIEETPPPLRYHETLDVFNDVIEEYYYRCEMDVYRTAVTDPPTEYDITPKRRRNSGEQGQELPFVYTQEEIDLMDKDEKKNEVGRDALSVHKSEKKEIKEAKRAAAAFSKKHTAEETEDYKINQRGAYVMKLHISPEKALVSKKFHSGTGHGNILLREGVTIEDILDKSYKLKPFKYDEDDKQ